MTTSALPPGWTLDLARRMARHVIRAYEGAEDAADAFLEQYKPRSHKDGEALRAALVTDYKAACGGKKMYEGSKAFLAANCRCKGTGYVEEQVNECTCGGTDIGVGIMHEPGCGTIGHECPDCRPAWDVTP